MDILGHPALVFIQLFIVFVLSGILCGAVTNWIVGKKFYYPGGLIGGAVVGFLLLLL